MQDVETPLVEPPLSLTHGMLQLQSVVVTSTFNVVLPKLRISLALVVLTERLLAVEPQQLDSKLRLNVLVLLHDVKIVASRPLNDALAHRLMPQLLGLLKSVNVMLQMLVVVEQLSAQTKAKTKP